MKAIESLRKIIGRRNEDWLKNLLGIKGHRIKNLSDSVSIIPKNIVEIGVWKGDFSQLISNEFPKAKLILIDPWKVSEKNNQINYGSDNSNQDYLDKIYKKVVNRFSNKPNISLFRGNIREFYSLNSLLKVDLFYVDGDHSYDGVISDLECCHEMTKKNSVIILDDYGINESWWEDDVIRAVHDFLGKYSNHYVIKSKIKSQLSIEKIKD
tara:strand:+ start:134 stop:763 length:630 start_codon:yes stop_codon:yes gene_type:complete